MENCIVLYNDLLSNIKLILKVDVTEKQKQLDCIKEALINKFFFTLTNDDLFLLFSKMKIKVFSAKTVETHEISTVLFGEELPLKHLFNNQPEIIKNQSWDKLFRLYIELLKLHKDGQFITPEKISTRTSALEESINQINLTLSSKVKSNILKVDVNNSTNNMIDDIVGSFQNIMSNKGANPFDNIMNITTMISDKYRDQLQNGDIQLDKIMGGMEGIIPGLMKQQDKPAPVVIDENFSTTGVDIGKEEEGGGGISDMMKMLPGMGGLMNMVQRINNVDSETDITAIKNEMDNYLEKELKVDMTQFKQTMNDIENKMKIPKEQEIINDLD